MTRALKHSHGWGYAAAYVVALCLLVPWEPFRMSVHSIDAVSVDFAFIVALPSLFQSGAQFGTDIVFTYGPWGLLTTNIAPSDIYPLIVFLRGLFAIVVAHIAVFTVFTSGKSSLAQASLALGLCGLIALWVSGIEQALWMFPSLFLGIYYISRRDDETSKACLWLALAATAAAGLFGLVKFNIFLFGLFVQLVIAVLDLSQRRIPVLFVTWLGASCAAWVAAGQQLVHFPKWIFACLSLSGGYSDAMSKGFTKPFDWSTVGLLFAGLCCFLTFVLFVSTTKKNRRVGLCLFLVNACIAALAWQHAMGGNQMEQAVGEVLGALWFLVAVKKKRDTNARYTGFRTAILPLLTIGLFVVAIKRSSELDLFSMASASLDNKLTGLRLLSHGKRSAWKDPWADLMADVRQAIPIPAGLAGSADIYPQHTAVVIAQPQLRYTPRPAFLSLNAHTRSLALRNAEFLQTNAPDVVLFQILHPSRSVNNRHPATADGPSWPELITRYSPDSSTDDFLILKKRQVPLLYERIALATGPVPWDQEIPIDTNSRLIWATLKIRPSPLGRLVKALYKAPHVLLVQTFADGSKTESQIVPALGEAGFLLSPPVSDTRSFTRLFQAPASATSPHRTLISIQLKTEPHMAWFWSPRVHLGLEKLEIEKGQPRPLLPVALSNDLAINELKDNVGRCMFPPSRETASDVDDPIYLFHAPCTTHIGVPKDARGAILTYGLRWTEKADKIDTDGAQIQLSAIGNRGEILKSASRVLEPQRKTQDRGPQQITLEWEASAAARLDLDFNPGPHGNASYDHTYVSRIEFLFTKPNS